MLPLGCQDLGICNGSKWRRAWSQVLTWAPRTPPVMQFWNLHQNNPEPGSQCRLLCPAPDELVGPGHLCFGQALHDSDAAHYGNHQLGRSMDGLERIHAPRDTDNNILFLHVYLGRGHSLYQVLKSGRASEKGSQPQDGEKRIGEQNSVKQQTHATV